MKSKTSKASMHEHLPTTSTHNKQEVFFLIDGDSVGDRLHLLLLDNELTEAERFSAAVSRALLEIRDRLLLSGARISFVGGDEILGTIPATEVSSSLFSEIRATFNSLTGCTLSVGVGIDPRGAFEALQRAKLSGRDRIVGDKQ